MQKTLEHTRANDRISSECIGLLIRERSKGKSLRQLGRIFNRSHERIRQVLTRCEMSQEPLLPEAKVAANLGYLVNWLIQLRKEGITNPVKRGRYWLYSEEQVKQIPSLIAKVRKCERCGKLRPPGYPRFCRECSQYRKKHPYLAMSPDEKAEHVKRCLAWRKANPERWKEIQFKAQKKYRTKHLGRISYPASSGSRLPVAAGAK